MLEGEGKHLYLQDEDTCSSGNVENSVIGFGFFSFSHLFFVNTCLYERTHLSKLTQEQGSDVSCPLLQVTSSYCCKDVSVHVGV